MIDGCPSTKVTHMLPEDNTIVMCYGHKTLCCKLDMEKKLKWHLVRFKLEVTGYKLKEEVPDDPEESILASYSARESWDILNEDGEHEFPDGYVVGVTEWKEIQK